MLGISQQFSVEVTHRKYFKLFCLRSARLPAAVAALSCFDIGSILTLLLPERRKMCVYRPGTAIGVIVDRARAFSTIVYLILF